MALNLKKAKDFYNGLTQNVRSFLNRPVQNNAFTQGLVNSAARVNNLVTRNPRELFLPTSRTPAGQTFRKVGIQEPIESLKAGYRLANVHPVASGPRATWKDPLTVARLPLTTMSPVVSQVYRGFPALYGAIDAARTGGDIQSGAFAGVRDYAGPSRALGNENTKLGRAIDTADIFAGMFLGRGVDDIALRSTGILNKLSRFSKVSKLNPEEAAESVGHITNLKRMLDKWRAGGTDQIPEDPTRLISIAWKDAFNKKIPTIPGKTAQGKKNPTPDIDKMMDDLLKYQNRILEETRFKLSNTKEQQITDRSTREGKLFTGSKPKETFDVPQIKMGIVGKGTQQSLYDEASKYKDADEFFLYSKKGKEALREQGIKSQEAIKDWFKKTTGNTKSSYSMSHRPSETGGTLDDITNKGQVMPQDVYTHPEWYANMSDPAYRESFEAIKKFRGKPDAEVTIYRASRKNEINPGDWVTLSKKYAQQEARADTKVYAHKVKAKDIQFAGDDINEFGYFPKNVAQPGLPSKQSLYDTSPLVNEARKYKSADEFVSKQIPVYHGSPVPLKRFSNKKGGVYFTEDYADATGFAGSPDNVYEGFLNFKKPLVIDAKGAKWDKLNTKYGKSTQEVISNAQKDGYDGVVFKNVIDNVMDDAEAGMPGTIYYAYKPADAFIDESQLADIFTQAKKNVAQGGLGDTKPLTNAAKKKYELQTGAGMANSYLLDDGKFISDQYHLDALKKLEKEAGTKDWVEINKRFLKEGNIRHLKVTEYVPQKGKVVDNFMVELSKKPTQAQFTALKNEYDNIKGSKAITLDITTEGGTKSFVVDSIDELKDVINKNVAQGDTTGIRTAQNVRPGNLSASPQMSPRPSGTAQQNILEQRKTNLNELSQSNYSSVPQGGLSDVKGPVMGFASTGNNPQTGSFLSKLKLLVGGDQSSSGIQKVTAPSVSGKPPSVPGLGEISSTSILPEKGKLNVKNLNLSEDQQKLVRTANDVQPTVISNKSVVEKSKLTKGANAPMSDAKQQEVLAQRLNSRQKVITLTREFEQLKKSGADEATLIKKFGEIADQSRIAQQEGTFAGRQLQAQNILADELASPQQKVLALLDNAGVDKKKYLKDAVNVDWNNGKQVVEFYRKYVPPKFSEWLTEYRYTNMLSSPLTHIVNTATNVFQTGVVAPIEKTITGGLDWVKSKMTGSEREYYASDGINYAVGYYKSLPQAWNKFKKVLSGEEITVKPDMERIPVSTKGFAKAYTTPLRALEAADNFFMELVKGGERATIRGGNVELKAENAARYRLFRQAFDPEGKTGQGHLLKTWDKYNSFINQLRRLPGGNWIVPFLQTPTNILKQGVEYSPLGLATLPGSKNKLEQLSKTILGSTVFMGTYGLLNSAEFTWEVPKGQKERELFYAANMQPYSIKIGDKWVSYSKLGPLSYPVAMAAALRYAEKYDIGSDKNSPVSTAIGGMLKFFSDQSYVKQLGDFIDSVQTGKGVVEGLKMEASNAIGQLVPYRSFQGWLTRLIDPYNRKSNGFVSNLTAQVPGLSQTNETYYNPITKGPSERSNRFFNSFSPVRVTSGDEQIKRQFDYTSNAKRSYANLKNLPREEAIEILKKIKKNNPAMFREIKKVSTQEKLQMTAQEKQLEGLSVADGERSYRIKEQLDKLETREEKVAYLKRLKDLGILTDNVIKQLKALKNNP